MALIKTGWLVLVAVAMVVMTRGLWATVYFEPTAEAIAANRWLTEIYEPITAMVPAEARGKLEPAEIFHEILVHRWYLSERAGHEVGIFETARDYIDNVLTSKPDELVTADEAGEVAGVLPEEDQDASVL